MNSSNNLDLALQYASKYGWHIQPVHGITNEGKCTCGRPHNDPKEIGKHPASPNGQQDATTDLGRIQSWWEENPDYNIGVFCKPSGFFAIDIDPRSGGDESFITLEERSEGSIIPTVEAITGEYNIRGKSVRGRHLIYRCNAYEPFMKNLDKVGLKGIDIKHNGYIVISPSRHFSGITYDWKPGHAPWETEIAEAPEELLNCLRAKNTVKSTLVTHKTGDYASLVELAKYSEKVDAERILQEGLIEGNRAVGVYQLACSLANKYGTDPVSRSMIETTLIRFNAEMIRPPLELDGPNSLLMHVRRAIEFVAANPIPMTPVVEQSFESRALLDTNDSEVVDWLVPQFSGKYIWCAGRGWLIYSEGVWDSRSDEHVREQLRTFLHERWMKTRENALLPGSDSSIRSLLSVGKLKEYELLLRGGLEVLPKHLDTHHDLINAANGVVDLKSGALLPHSKDYLFTLKTPTAYVPGSHHNDWDKALEAIPNYSRDWLQTYVGVGCTGWVVKEDIIVLLLGGGRNGKSTVVHMPRVVLGKYAKQVSDRILTGRAGDHTTELTDLFGCRLALLEELPDYTISTARLKQITSTSVMTGRRMRQDDMEWIPTHTLLIASNFEPTVPSGDAGTWRRLVKVSFPYRYVANPSLEHDRKIILGLRERLIEGGTGQHEAVFTWMVEGAMKWYSNGKQLPPLPDEVVAATEEWRASQDILGGFLSEHLTIKPGSYTTVEDLFTKYKSVHPEDPLLDNLTTFSSALRAHEFCHMNGLKFGRKRTKDISISRPGGMLNTLPAQSQVVSGLAFNI